MEDVLTSRRFHLSCYYAKVLNVLDCTPELNNILFPTTQSDFDRQSHLFARDGRNPLRGCVSAIDGLAVRIRRPSVRDAPNPIAYYNRKGFFAVNVQAAVGADFKVQFLSAIATGSCHDSVAFSASGLSRHLAEDGSLPDGYWVAADDAYVAGRRVLTPWPGRNLPWERDSFNYYQSSARIFVEQTFGQLVGRWGILWKPILFSLPTPDRFAFVPSSITFSLTGAALFHRSYKMTRLAGLGKCCSRIDMTTTQDCDIVVGMERSALSAWL